MSHYDKPCRNMKFEAIKKAPQMFYHIGFCQFQMFALRGVLNFKCLHLGGLKIKKAKRFALLFAGFNQIDYLTNSLN